MEKVPVVSFDREAKCFTGLTDDLMLKLSETFPNMDIEFQLKRMELWLLSPKGSRRKGSFNFILSWLSRSWAQIPTGNVKDMCPLDRAITRHLQGLWKNREHILKMNKKR